MNKIPINGKDFYKHPVFERCYVNPDGFVVLVGGKRRGSVHRGWLNHNGYYYVNYYIKNEDRYKKLYVHRLVADLFIPKPEDYDEKHYEINHIDGCRGNNNVDNLEWVTPKENINHPITKHHFSSRSGKSRNHAIILFNSENKQCLYFDSIKQASNTLGISYSALCQLSKFKHNGYKSCGGGWKMLDIPN